MDASVLNCIIKSENQALSKINQILHDITVGLRRAVRRVRKSAYGGAIFVKIGTHTKFDLGNHPLGLFLLFGVN